MNPEDELHDRLRQELGDPASTDPTGPAGASDSGWAAIEEASERRRQRDRRLVLAATATAAVVVVALALVLAAHTDRSSSTALRTGSGQTTLAPASSSTSSGPTTTPTTGSVLPGTVTTLAPGTIPVTTIGPTRTTTTAPTTSSTTPAGQIDCGTAYLASGWPTTILASPTLQQCILSAFAAGTPAIYRERAQTDGEGGHIEITTYEVIGVRQARRTIDATGAQPPGGITVSVCSGLASGPDGQLAASGCA